MYCGDETGSFIGEVGSHTCRFGYGGEDNPKLVLPSYVSSNSSNEHKTMSLSTLSSTPGTSSRSTKNEISTAVVEESILRMPQQLSHGANSSPSSYSTPIIDPNEFLRQGDCVEHWDNLQVAWETSMSTLRARDTLKHTRGGAPYNNSSSGSRKRHASGIFSSSVPSLSSAAAASQSSSAGTPPDNGKCVHPILAITPGCTELYGHGRAYCAAVRREQSIQYTEMIMESLDATSMFLAPAPMVAAFSFGRQTALVVDMGAGGCRVTPVVDGLLLKHSQRRNGRGGDWLGHVTWRAMLEESINPIPRYSLRGRAGGAGAGGGKDLGSSNSNIRNTLFHTRAMNDLMYEVRTEPFMRLHLLGTTTTNSTVRLPFTKAPVDPSLSSTDHETLLPPSSSTGGGGTGVEGPSSSSSSPSSYQLPDGTNIDLSTPFGRDLCQLPELLFADRVPFLENSIADSSLLPTMSNEPLHSLIRSSLLSVGDVDVRKELTGCICLTGSTSLMPNIDIRLSQELPHILPSFVKPRILSSRISVEKSCAAWIGASILTSLGSFQQLWLSRAEYDEYGTTMSIQRFP
jgi:actin-related protein